MLNVSELIPCNLQPANVRPRGVHRREFLKIAAAAVAAASLAGGCATSSPKTATVGDSSERDLILRAIDAAMRRCKGEQVEMSHEYY